MSAASTRQAIVVAVTAVACLALSRSASADGIIIADGDRQVVFSAFGDGSANWTGRGLIAGQIHVDITSSYTTDDRFFTLLGVVTASNDGLLDGRIVVVVADRTTGDYRVFIGYSNNQLSFDGTGMVRVLP